MSNQVAVHQAEDDEQDSYRQQLGLKKMLYKYQHQNQQLKAQIKALTQRLADIIVKKQQQPQMVTISASQQFRLKSLKQQMKKLFIQIQKTTNQIKIKKQELNQNLQLKYIQIDNQIKKQEKEIQEIQLKLSKYQKMQKMKNFVAQTQDLKNSSLRINNNAQKLAKIQVQTDQLRKKIRDLQKLRDLHDKAEVKRHIYAVDLNLKIRKLSNVGKQTTQVDNSGQKKGFGIWNMDYDEQTFNKIKIQLVQLKKQKTRIIQSLKNENIVLKKRYSELSIQTQEFNKAIHLPPLQNNNKTIQKTNRKQNDKFQISLGQTSVNPPKLLNVGPKQFQRSNDKNYSPKKLRKVEWQSSQYKGNGIEWNDAHLKSPIIGMDLWFDGYLMGVQCLHKMGESGQHLYLTSKAITPINYRLNGSDYLQNVILWISDNKIVGIQLISKGGRNDGFGSRGKGRKFDLGIKQGEKPVFSYALRQQSWDFK